MERYAVTVVGAGASGLMAANRAALALGQNGGGVLLLEGNPKSGRKLLATGNGRCNLTNLNISPARYHGDPLGAEVLERFPPDRVLEEFRHRGLLCRADEAGRVYPNGNQAAAVLQCLRGSGKALSIGELCEFEVVSIRRTEGGFLLADRDGKALWTKKCVLACGGKASPKHSRGSGYDLAKSLGHTVTELTPSLVPLKTPGKVCTSLKGMRARAKASLYRMGKKVCTESGEVIFGEGQLSGICIFNLSARLRETGLKELEVGLDLLENMDLPAVMTYLEQLRKDCPHRLVRELFSGALQLRVGQEVVKAAGLPLEKLLSSIAPGELERAAKLVKDWRFPITGPGSWESAQITAGGVPLREINLRTMESKLCPGLYLAGEMLDVDGDCGGYNLHWAWATGMIAGDSAGKK